MHTFLPGCRVAFLGRPRQRLSPPTYWFIRGDLEPPCHMLPQMGTSPQAIQALWQQAWNIMDAKGKRERALSAPQTTQTLCVRIHICTYVDYKAFVCSCVISCDFFAFVCPTTYMCRCVWHIAGAIWTQKFSCVYIITKHNMFARSEHRGRCQFVDVGRQGREERCDQPTSDRQQHADHVPPGQEPGRRAINISRVRRRWKCRTIFFF